MAEEAMGMHQFTEKKIFWFADNISTSCLKFAIEIVLFSSKKTGGGGEKTVWKLE